MNAATDMENDIQTSYRLLGCRINPLTSEQLTLFLIGQVEQGTSCVIANHNLHSLHLVQKDLLLQQFFRAAECIHIDGMGVIAVGRALGIALLRTHRVTYVDWLPTVIREAHTRGWRLFYLGSKPGVAARAFQAFRDKLPDLVVETAHGHFPLNGVEEEALIERIRFFAPDILFVGMGMPRQEHWILRHRARLGSAVILCCGAAIDYFAGEIPTPPRWAGRCGLEWFYRLLAEPTRLWKRYLIEPWNVLRIMAGYWLRANRSRQ